MTRIGLLGGTFDPPHLGHLVAAEAARETLGLDEVRWLVAGRPWMKGGETAARHRVAMAEAAVADAPAMTVDDREARRDGPTYTVDTLRELAAADPDVAWTFLLGTDAAASLPAWHRVEEALVLADWAVVRRPDAPWPRHRLADRLHPVDIPLIGVSSTGLRERVAAGRSIRYLVPRTVLDYITRHRLYVSADG
jgi:nicotinate-nucleotide adenylyltransferase